MLIELKNVKKYYRTGKVNVKALDGVNLSVERGEFLSIMGPSGSGKSTLLNIIGCLDKPTEGEYLLDGKNVQKLNDDELSSIRNESVGFVFQTFHLLPEYDAVFNVEIPLIYRGVPAKERRKRAEKALEVVGLKDRMKHRPLELSGGEQQRVAIARALVQDPLLILADEPTGALDSKTGNSIMELFCRLNEEKGLTIILVTHDEKMAKYGKRIVHILDGKIEREAYL